MDYEKISFIFRGLAGVAFFVIGFFMLIFGKSKYMNKGIGLMLFGMFILSNQ